jgi:hypothetical protein
MLQAHLNLAVHQRTVLVTQETVRASLGIDADSVAAKVDCGELRWVWDISAGGGEIRELRFWARELIAPSLCVALQLDAVIDSMIGTTRAHLRAVEVGQLLLCSRPHILAHVREGDLSGPLVGHTQSISRASLVAYFRGRLVGSVPTIHFSVPSFSVPQ